MTKVRGRRSRRRPDEGFGLTITTVVCLTDGITHCFGATISTFVGVLCMGLSDDATVRISCIGEGTLYSTFSALVGRWGSVYVSITRALRAALSRRRLVTC